MADENASDTDTPTPAEVEQLEFEFPNTDDYPSYDETDSDDGQAELPEDNFDETSVSEDEDEEGCGCVPS